MALEVVVVVRLAPMMLGAVDPMVVMQPVSVVAQLVTPAPPGGQSQVPM